MSEKSGIEMIEEILYIMKDLQDRVSIIEAHIKAIANSANLSKLVENAANADSHAWANAIKPMTKDKNREKKEAGFKNFRFEATDASKMKDRVPKKHNRSNGMIMAKGKLKIMHSGKAIPLAGISVKIYDSNDNLVKSTKTNKAGHWMSQLAPGRYVALFEGELNGQKLLPQNKNFEIPANLPPGENEFEVI